MSTQVSRRVLLAGLAAAASVTAAGCSTTGEGQGGDALRVTSWGDPTKVKLRGQVVDRFQELHPDIPMLFEGSPVAGYFDKLATQISAGSPPDIINMDSAHMAQYTPSGVLAELDEFNGNLLKTDTLDKLLLDQGMLDGKLYGVPFAQTGYSWGYNQTLFDKLGLAAPTDWTYDSFATLAEQLHQQAGPKVFGAEDMSGDLASFEVWLRANGGQVYDGDQLAFDDQTLVEWFEYWSRLRQNGGITPADIAAQYTYDDATGGPIAAGKCAITHIFINNFTGSFQALTKDKLKMTTPPTGSTGQHGAYPTPSSVFCISSQCADKTAAATFVDWFVNSPDSAEVLRFISGPTASSEGIKGLQDDPDLTAEEKEIIDYAAAVSKNAVPAPPIKPAANTEIGTLLLRTSQELGFGRTDIPSAAKTVIDGAKDLLSQQ